MKQNQNQKGRKFDSEKLRWDLLPWKETEEVVDVLTFGAQKYEDWNWTFVDDWKNRYFAAAMRHLTSYFNGELKDPESDRSHLAHALCCILFLLYKENNK